MTDNSNANTLGDLGRLLMQLLNYGVYFLLAIMYQIFFNVASAQLFESETIKNFYGRIQLIIGVFMVFKLAVTILQGIMNPDQFMNPKEGFGNFITRVIVALALLTVLVPINVPDVQNANSFEKYLNNNGLLFGTLYSLQDRILSNNTLGRLILGTTDNATGVDESNDAANGTQKDKLAQSSRIFSSTILKAFLRINLKPTEAREDDDETKRENWYCNETLDDQGEAAINTYTQLDVDPTTLLSWEFLTADCELNDSWLSSLGNSVSWIPIVGLFTSNTRYVFAFNWLAACIVGIIFLIIMIGFTIDIAIRSIKLAILRLIAPIPVISYIEPKSSKDGGMFSSWVKALTSTYLDLFLRLAIVYFVLFIIQDMIINGVIIDEAGGMVGIISFIFIMLGLFFFAKMAPKFIKDALGLKGAGMSNVGLSGILGGAAMAAGGGGLAGFAMGAMNGTDAAVKGQAQGKPVPLGAAWSQNSDLMAKIRTGDKDARGGIWGRTLDHLNYSTRERRAKMMGIGNQDVADAEYLYKYRQAQASNAKQQLDFAQQKLSSLGPNATQAERDQAMSAYQEAYKLYDDYQTKATIAKSKYDKMDKDRGQMGVGPRISDKRENKYSARGANGTYRSPIAANENPFTVGGAAPLPLSPPSDEEILGTISGHKRNLDSFNGTTDDSTFGSSHNGPGGGPGGPPPGP